MKLYQKIKIPDFDKKQQELLELVKGKFTDPNELTWYDPPFSEIVKYCPTLANYLVEKSKTRMRLFRIYHSPAQSGLGVHIDGDIDNRSPIGLNLPISNCKQSAMKWWDESNAKMITGPYGYNNLPACKILNPKELTCIGSVEIDVPTFVRTDVIHSVENYNNEPRLILSIRWAYNAISGQHFNQVMDYEPYDN